MRKNLLIYRKVLMLLMIFCSAQLGLAQETSLSLDVCHKEVQENYPLIKGKELLRQSSQLNVENLKVDYLPKLHANGKLSYQSDVTGITIPGLEPPRAPKDQYALNVDVEQLIYNAGRTKNRIKLEEMASEVEIQNLEVQMYQLREQVNNAYFSILLIRKSKSVLLEKQKTILARLQQVRSAVKNGVILPANQKILEAELLLIEQQIRELDASEESAFVVLSELMGRKLNKDVQLQELQLDETVLIQEDWEQKARPEYQWYTNRKLLLDEQIQLTKKDRYPVVTGFGQMGYGNPGYNQLMDEFDTYYMVGAKVSWNIFDWKSARRKQKSFSLQKDLVETQELSFETNQKIELGNETNNINKYKILLEKDDAIIELQAEVSQSSASQLDNGVITSSDYLEDLNKEIQARLNREFHFIQLQQSLAEYKRIKGI